MLSGIDSSSKKGEKSSQTSICSSRRLSMGCSFRSSRSLATFPRPQLFCVDWLPCGCQCPYHTILTGRQQESGGAIFAPFGVKLAIPCKGTIIGCINLFPAVPAQYFRSLFCCVVLLQVYHVWHISPSLSDPIDSSLIEK